LRLEDGTAAWSKPASLPAVPELHGVTVGWARPLRGPGADPSVREPALFVATGSSVTALNAVTGGSLWSRALPETRLLGPPVAASAAADETTVYAAGISGKVYALSSSTGADAPGGLTTASGSITGPLALVDQYLYVPTTTALVAADAATGLMLWSSPLAATTGVAVAEGVPYVGTGDTRLVGFSSGSPPPVAVVHDLAIESLQIAPRVSRRTGAAIRVTLINRGTHVETYTLLVRVQPGRIILLDQRGTLAPGQKVVESIPWPSALMGETGPTSLIAQVSVVGEVDDTPLDNHALQFVTVGP
jgi:outer membrane protein assembly factor BamB